MNNFEVKNILVIRFRRVGDSVLSIALCSSLRQSFPNAKIDYVINKGTHVLYENHPDVDRLVVFSEEEKHRFFHYIRRVWETVHATHYDVIIDMRTTVQTLWFSLFSLRSRYRIGSKKTLGRGILTDRVDNRKGDLDMVRRNLMFLDPLSKCTEVKKTEDFKLYVDDDRRKSFREYMLEKGIDFSRPVILSTPAVRLAYKAWDKDKMTEIFRRLVERYNAQIIFNYSGDEERKCVMEYVNTPPPTPPISVAFDIHRY